MGNVDRPAHYGNSTVIAETIEKYIPSFCLSSAAKYLFRAGKKDAAKEVEDLQKAVFYINLKIKLLEGGCDASQKDGE